MSDLEWVKHILDNTEIATSPIENRAIELLSIDYCIPARPRD